MTATSLQAQYRALESEALGLERQNAQLKKDLFSIRSADVYAFPGRLALKMLNWAGAPIAPLADVVGSIWRFRLLVIAFGFLAFVAWKRREVAYVFSRPSLARTFWWRREKPTPVSISLSSAYVVVLALSVLIALTLWRSAIRIHVPSGAGAPEFPAPRKIALMGGGGAAAGGTVSGEAAAPYRALPVILPPNAAAAREELAKLDPEREAGREVHMDSLEKRTYPELPLPTRFLLGDPTRWYLLALLSVESKSADALETFKRYFEALPERLPSASLGPSLEYLQAALRFVCQQGGPEALRSCLPRDARWTKDAAIYRNLLEWARNEDRPTDADAVFSIGLSNCQGSLTEFESLLSIYFAGQQAEARQEFWEQFFLRSREQQGPLVAGAILCHKEGLSELSGRFLAQAAALARWPRDLPWLAEVASRIDLMPIVSDNLAKASFPLEELTTELNAGNLTFLNCKGCLDRTCSLGMALAAAYQQAGRSDSARDVAHWTLAADYSEGVAGTYPSDLEEAVQGASTAFWRQPPLSPSFRNGTARQWNNLQLALNMLSASGDRRRYESLMGRMRAKAREEQDIWRSYIDRLKTEQSALRHAIGMAKTAVSLDRILQGGDFVFSIFCIAFALWAGWIAAGVFPRFRLLTFLARSVEIYGVLLCISVAYLPLGVLLALAGQVWRFVTYRTEWTESYGAQQYQIFPIKEALYRRV